MRLRVNCDNVSEIMKSRIIQLVPEIMFNGLSQNKNSGGMVEQLLKAAVAGELSQLKIISNWYYDLSSISPELIMKAVVRLEETYIYRSPIVRSPEKMSDLIKIIAESPIMNLKSLDLFLV